MCRAPAPPGEVRRCTCRQVQPTSPTRRSRGTSRRYVCALGTGMVGCSCVGLMALTCGTGPATCLTGGLEVPVVNAVRCESVTTGHHHHCQWSAGPPGDDLMPKYGAHRAVPGRSRIHSPCRHSGDEHVPPVRVKHARGQQCRASLHVPDHSEGAPAAFCPSNSEPADDMPCLAVSQHSPRGAACDCYMTIVQQHLVGERTQF
jgi:hypothetical protein